jgi:Leucine-rich repeat (LRR) protein
MSVDEEPALDITTVKAGLSNISIASNGRDYAYVSLQLAGKHVKTFDLITDYKELKYLNLSNNELTSAAPLSELANLLTADLQANMLTNYDGADNKSLQLLQLDNNQITGLANVSLPSLRALTLSRNQIPALEFGNNTYPCLQVLDLSYNRLKNLQNISTLSSLKALNVNGNKISTLEGIQSCTALTKLLATDNSLASIQDLKVLSALPRLSILAVSRNAFYEETPDENEVQREVLIMIPNLDRLNTIPITVDSRVEADNIVKERRAEAAARLREQEENEREGNADEEDEGSVGKERDDNDEGEYSD